MAWRHVLADRRLADRRLKHRRLRPVVQRKLRRIQNGPIVAPDTVHAEHDRRKQRKVDLEVLKRIRITLDQIQSTTHPAAHARRVQPGRIETGLVRCVNVAVLETELIMTNLGHGTDIVTALIRLRSQALANETELDGDHYTYYTSGRHPSQLCYDPTCSRPWAASK